MPESTQSSLQLSSFWEKDIQSILCHIIYKYMLSTLQFYLLIMRLCFLKGNEVKVPLKSYSFMSKINL